ncbi:MAG: signal peptidase II [Anaerolineae bacterium]|nr:signal peptidase II [Anaerolineae bacterium]
MFPKLFIAFFSVLILDGLSKVWAMQTLEPYQPVPFIGQFFRWTLGFNTGVAFSIFTNSGGWPLILTGVVIVGLTVWSVRALRQGELPARAVWLVGLILGGAVANFIDRLLDGRVTDFIDLGLGAWRWPAFNLADSFIVGGVICLALVKMKIAPQEGEAAEPLTGDARTPPSPASTHE